MGNCLAKSSVNEMPNGVSELIHVPSGMRDSHVRQMPTIRVKQRGEINSIDEVIAGQLAKIKNLEELLTRYRDDVKSKDTAIAGHLAKIKDLEDRNDELLTRLSSLASAKLTDGNANIADLSDENRPTKLAEQFSELYDNEWTDAFERILKSKSRIPEDEACRILLTILCETYLICIEKAQAENDGLVNGMKPFCKEPEIPQDILKHFKDTRKKKRPTELGKIEEKQQTWLLKLLPRKKLRLSKKVNDFVNKCRELCWYMAVQDPPVYMDTQVNRTDEHFNINTHKPYTQSGIYVAFIVWPALYLCKSGNLLSKGVAQCKNSCKTLQITSGIETTLQGELTDQPISDQLNTTHRTTNDPYTNRRLEEMREKENTDFPSPRQDMNLSVTRLTNMHRELFRNTT